MSLIQTPCGFYQPMFDLLKERLKSEADENKHFIISIDEIHTRKNVTLNTKTMELSGLTDFGKGSQVDISDKADHGLVIMLQSLMGNFEQPIAVFASKGPVNLSKFVTMRVSLAPQV